MSISVAKLRVWLLVGAGLLVGVIAAFVGVAHYKAHRFIKNLPARLGVDIEQETTGFMYSQSDGAKGRTIYTIHAAKAQKRKDGKLALHDVGIVLYGTGLGDAQRVDRIYGKEFEYDQNTGVVRAIGEVHIDLQAPAPQGAKSKSEYAKGDDLHGTENKDQHLIHVTTQDLVFLQRLGTAATSAELEFEYNGMTGHAHGADYSTDTGDLVLEQAVKVEGMQGTQPAVLTADRAELKREVEQLLLSGVRYTVTGGKEGTRVTKAEQATAFLRPDGSVEWAKGEGGVMLADDDGTTVTAQRGDIHLNTTGRPQAAKLSGEVRYVLDEPLRQSRGEANEGHADFDKDGLLEHAVLSGAVHLQERTRTEAKSEAGWDERDLTAKAVDLSLAKVDGGKQSELQQARAEGQSRLMVVGNAPAKSGGPGGNRTGGKTISVLQGEMLTALFRPGHSSSAGRSSKAQPKSSGPQLKTVLGEGNTFLRRVNEDGAEITTSGDRLAVEFRERMTPETKAAGEGSVDIATAVQQGHVTIMNRPAAKAGAGKAPTEEHATAEKASYDGDKDELTLTGSVELNDVDGIVWADKVVMEHKTGDESAEGGVRATYLQPRDSKVLVSNSNAEPVHVLAARGEFKHATRRALFYGAAGPARLWQGTSQIEAPVIELQRTEGQLLAYGDKRSTGTRVHAVFLSGTGTGANGSTKTGSKQTPVRIAGRELIYNDDARRANFTGGVVVEDADGTLRAQQAVVFLKTADASSKQNGRTEANGSQGIFAGGSVERIVASGDLEILRAGRKVTGEQLIYTAADGLSVITGKPGAPPKMTDVAQGVVTGASLRFHAGDNSVVVSNGPNGSTGERVHTETQVK